MSDHCDVIVIGTEAGGRTLARSPRRPRVAGLRYV